MKLRTFPWRILTRKRYDKLVLAAVEREKSLKEKNLLEKLPDEMAGFFLKNAPFSNSQNLQDLFFIWELNKKRNGYFVEIGVCDGLLFSNTLQLEKNYGWQGILVEPARCWHDALKRNRSSIICHDFIEAQSGKTILFNEAPEPEFSGAHQLLNQDYHANRRFGGLQYELNTLSLNDLLLLNRAPRNIDFLSIDVEGGEFDILSHFSFDQFCIRAICCEHNFTIQREKIYALLSEKGYERKYENLSGNDDWYFMSNH